MAAAQISHVLVGPMTTLFNRVSGRDEGKVGGYTLSPMREISDSLRDHDSTSGPSRRGSFDIEAAQDGIEDRDTSPDSRLYQEDLHESGFTSCDDTCYGEADSARALNHDPSAVSSKLFSQPTLPRTRRLILLAYDMMDRTILIVAFIAFCTGLVTYWGLFQGRSIFNGIAHWIKGGVFFWLGIFTLGRWCGCLAEIGWAWNSRPGTSKRQFWLSPEFVESSLVFFYGSTNIFLEHLGGWGQAWTARDLEHLAITVLFIGGGLCGMLVEYVRVKGLGEKKAKQQHMQTMPAWSETTPDERTEHRSNTTTYEDTTQHKLNGISINPLPALVIFLMGGSMASHEQDSMVSTMVHKQWGNLLGAASVARLLTYLLMYLKPPTSTSPSRPPTELLMSFCLISGGIIFMASSSDTIDGMLHYGIDVMALYTVTMGFTGILMAWIMALLALKGWASR
ncbi:related to YTP1 [Cephalotrichum gorgonifer]|uniref:Related to YTP1 n=1 Tax=Cephalotrichum gorgonifer TaxID=2041049 RepID=A0AAE8SZE9_9PEZI|nr:related to YTP1 [Cephalotrichum gorgonifer]